jgi:colanic acid/amylovoran biosynthesis protein
MSIGKCVIVNSYSFKNAGDAAIMLATRDLLMDLGATEVIISTRYDDVDNYARHGVSVEPELIPFPSRGGKGRGARLVQLSLGLAAACVVIAASRVSRRIALSTASVLLPQASKVVKGLETVVIAGGGYMYSSKRRLNFSLWHSLATVRLAQALLPRTIMMPQSIGPITKRTDANLIVWALRNTEVVVRERVSLTASKVEPRLSRVRLVDDIAFYQRSQKMDLAPAYGDRPVRLVVMDWRWSTSVDAASFDNYVANVARLARSLSSLGIEVVVGGHSAIPEHDQDDIAVAQLVVAEAGGGVHLDRNCDVAHLYEEYARSAVVVGTRLHACIMALSVGVPAIALAYQEKSRGVMEGVGLEHLVFDAADFQADDVLREVLGLIATTRQEWRDRATRTHGAILSEYSRIIGPSL